MDRAFDPWSNTNENYYWELSKALYSKDAVGLGSVFDKYNIRYILLDEYLLSATNYRSLFIDETKQMFSGMPNIQQITSFGKLTLYEYKQTAQRYVSLIQNAPSVYPPYQWTDNDVAYKELGDYISSTTPDVVYAYRSLFTKRSVSERDFPLQDIPLDNLVYDSTISADLVAENVKACGLLKNGAAAATMADGVLRFESNDQRECLSFDIPKLEHKNGYLVAVESKHITGRPMMFSLINMTARHTELETYLPEDPNVQTSYFILPPLAPDGLGYTIYVANDAIGNYPSVNDLRRIRIYQIPYNDMVAMHTGNESRAIHINNFTVSHPNPSFYKVTTTEAGTLILSQSYDKGWIAWSGGKVLPHVLVNNWSNGWTINPGTSGTIYIFFWPQLLEFAGFALLPIPFLFICTRRHG